MVGDFVKLRSDESIPADMLLLNTSDANSVCHIETANLDGETNLKQREVVKGLNMVINKPVGIIYDKINFSLTSGNITTPQWNLSYCIKVALLDFNVPLYLKLDS